MSSSQAQEQSWYKAPENPVRQGDIVRLAPWLRAHKPPLLHLAKSKQTKGARVSAQILGSSSLSPMSADVAIGKAEAEFVFSGKLEFGILLTRGCEIENDKVRQLAPIRPLSTIQGPDYQADLIKGKHLSLYYLPEARLLNGVVFKDSFVDFRYLITLHSDSFLQLTRVVSLTRFALMNLYFGWLRHTIGRDIPQTTSCIKCNERIEIFKEIQPHFLPSIEY
jgi:hypothetical protein